MIKDDQSQSPSVLCFGPPPFFEYKRDSSAGDTTIDVHQGFFIIFNDVEK